MKPGWGRLELTEKIRGVLDRRFQDSGCSLRKLERQLGLASGCLVKILRDRRDLKFSDLLTLLAALGLKPGAFFAELAGEPLLSGVDGPTPELCLADQAALTTLDEIESRLSRCEEAISQALGSRENG